MNNDLNPRLLQTNPFPSNADFLLPEMLVPGVQETHPDGGVWIMACLTGQQFFGLCERAITVEKIAMLTTGVVVPMIIGEWTKDILWYPMELPADYINGGNMQIVDAHGLLYLSGGEQFSIFTPAHYGVETPSLFVQFRLRHIAHIAREQGGVC